jgi:hypothetical protein
MKGGKDECANLSHNHQVLAVGYRNFEKYEHVQIKIYDPNYPNSLQTLSAKLAWDFIDCQESTGERWRGFFVNPEGDAASA